jgi:hypothetical protein
VVGRSDLRRRYNVVAEVSRRKRAVCHAHLRRYFHEALPTAPIAQHAIDLILGLATYTSLCITAAGSTRWTTLTCSLDQRFSHLPASGRACHVALTASACRP